MPSRQRHGPYPPPALGHRRFSGAGPWEIAVTGDLGDRQNDVLSRLVDVPRNSRGTIFFDSGGGSVYAGLALASLIRMRGLDCDGVVVGECSSAALLPFAACARRYVTQHSSLLFHPVRWQSDEDVRYEEAVEWARHFASLEKDLDGLLSRLFDYPEEKIHAWTRPGKFVSGRELVDAGLATLVDLFNGDVWKQISQASGGASAR
ncbi:MAG: ClpP family protease [Planctomycetaceae bacterium]